MVCEFVLASRYILMVHRAPLWRMQLQMSLLEWWMRLNRNAPM